VRNTLQIAMIASECVPYAKTGGLADVVGSLPHALRALGHEVIVILPKYGSIDPARYGLRRHFDSLGVWMGDSLEWCAVDVADSDGVAVYFIENDRYFQRDGLYHDAAFNDFNDNPARFGFLTRAGLQLCHDMNFAPNIVHVHDWQTALGAAYLKIWHWNDPVLGGAASVLTIHNIAYQGKYDAGVYNYLGLGWGNFTADKFEDFGGTNFLKGGIVYADMVNTVSPTYAAETRTPALGYGLAPYLNDRGGDYLGIVNGVDYDQWDPATDPLIPANYTPDDLGGKAVCKHELQARLGLETDPNIPLVGVVSRLAEQKGLDVLAATIEDIVQAMHVQFVLLGSGDPALEQYFGALPAAYPGRIASYIGYSNELAHWIEAGSDFFIMPSRYEPCGLNQIYSLKYGTLPIVRATGGLEDTVQQYNEATGEGAGFKFVDLTPSAIYYAVGWAVSTYYDRPTHMQRMIQEAMAQDFSWEKSARQYLNLYRRAIENKAAL
jgi:starch synthase